MLFDWFFFFFSLPFVRSNYRKHRFAESRFWCACNATASYRRLIAETERGECSSLENYFECSRTKKEIVFSPSNVDTSLLRRCSDSSLFFCSFSSSSVRWISRRNYLCRPSVPFRFDFSLSFSSPRLFSIPILYALNVCVCIAAIPSAALSI